MTRIALIPVSLVVAQRGWPELRNEQTHTHTDDKPAKYAQTYGRDDNTLTYS